MKLIEAFIHHVRTAAVVEALADGGFRNLSLQDVRGMLKPITEDERAGHFRSLAVAGGRGL